MDTAARRQDPPMFAQATASRRLGRPITVTINGYACMQPQTCQFHTSIRQPSCFVPGQSTAVGPGKLRSSVVAHARRAKLADIAIRQAAAAKAARLRQQQQQQPDAWQQFTDINSKKVTILQQAGRGSPGLLSAANPAATWAISLAALVLLIGSLSKLMQQHTRVADQSHLQLLGAAAAAGSSDGEDVIHVPGPSVSAALLELQQHKQQLSHFKQEVDMLQSDAEVLQHHLGHMLQTADAQLETATQTAVLLDSELSDVGNLLQQQHTILANLTAEAAAAAAAHRDSLAVSHNKVTMLQNMLVTLQQQAHKANDSREQVVLLEQQLEEAKSRLIAAEQRALHLESHLALLSEAKGQMTNRLTVLEKNAATAAAAARQAVLDAEDHLAAITARSTESTAAVAAVAAALQQREEELLQLQQQLQEAQGALDAAAAEAQAAVAAAAVVGHTSLCDYPVANQPTTVAVTVRLVDEQGMPAGTAVAAVGDGTLTQQQQRAAVASLSAAVLLKGAEVAQLHQQLEQQLAQVKAAAAARSAELQQLAAAVSDQLAAAHNTAEDERVHLAAVKGEMSEVYDGILRMRENSARIDASYDAAEADENAASAGAGAAGSSDEDVIIHQLEELQVNLAVRIDELSLLMILAKMKLSPEQKIVADLLEMQQDKQQQHQQQLLELLRGHLSQEQLRRERSLRKELQQLQQQQQTLQQQLDGVQAAAAAAAAEEREAAEQAAREEAAAAAQAKAAAEKEAKERAAAAAAAARAKAEEEARIAREAAAAEQARLRAAAEARAREEAAALAAAQAAAAEAKAEAAARKAEQERQQQDAAKLAAVQTVMLDALAAAESRHQQLVQQQHEAAVQQQQQHQQSDQATADQVQSQLLQLSALQLELEQQGSQLSALRFRYEEQLADAAAAASDMAAEVSQITQEVTDIQSSLESCHAELVKLQAAAEAISKASADAAWQQQQQVFDGSSGRRDHGGGSISNGIQGGSSSSGGGSSNRRTLQPPGGGDNGSAVLFVDQDYTVSSSSSSKKQRQHQSQRSSTSTAATATKPAAAAAVTTSAVEGEDDILKIAQKLLDQNSNGGYAAAAAAVTTRQPTKKQQQQQIKRRALRLHSGGYLLPHPAKRATGGEDAFFVSAAGCGCVGVADGVGGWAEEGVDAAAYAKGLMNAAADVCESCGGTETPVDILKYAQSQTLVPGSCTAVIAVLRPSHQLDICVVGDAGLRIIRNNNVIFATDVQEHAFNMPYQLACAEIIDEADTPDAGLHYSTEVLPGDVIVAGSDGLFDNMWDEQIAEMVADGIASVRSASSKPPSAARLARRIAEKAAANAVNSDIKTPWAVEVAEQAPQALGFMSRLFGPKGGKVDDIAVVVAVVQ